ncbi:polynucleotide adenylyltransferase PcnB [Leeia sp. TBRC 13508]|uniref:Poly(A) polymerase I n=1 Tax=Leeia speluncae TaxID=2884804 RepID=A0ABS8D7L1_9NEIS|nr:polynucleotide adenylyltransferase PcnB [Leeia speluncae]MCB6184137.1 polynucleotide adenylyltransferase PcnB [Leeia speluncae]
MIRKLIRRVLRLPMLPHGGAEALPLKKHGITREQISGSALKVTDKLQAAGYTALVVGGAVRDLLLGREPKDFDVATNATPEEVQRIFGRRARIIGRRFRIVHVPFGPEIIEVTTFRGDADDVHTDEETGRILRDNVWGDQEQDARRRDFTANALYYDPAKQVVYDYHHGLRDLERRQLVMIGDPERRYREDPVRMLRAIRLAAKLELSIEQGTEQPIESLTPLLAEVPQARLFDELTKMLLSGAAGACLEVLYSSGLYKPVMPQLGRIMSTKSDRDFLQKAMSATDDRIKAGKSVNPAFQMAALLWPQVQRRWEQLQGSGQSGMQAMMNAIEDVLDRNKGLAPARHAGTMREIWSLQPRFDGRTGRKPFRLLENGRFRAAYDFLVLRASADDSLKELAEWWTAFQHADAGEQTRMLEQDSPVDPSKRKRRRRRRKPNDGGGQSGAEE